jgi:hypothetical protein
MPAHLQGDDPQDQHQSAQQRYLGEHLHQQDAPSIVRRTSPRSAAGTRHRGLGIGVFAPRALPPEDAAASFDTIGHPSLLIDDGARPTPPERRRIPLEIVPCDECARGSRPTTSTRSQLGTHAFRAIPLVAPLLVVKTSRVPTLE